MENSNAPTFFQVQPEKILEVQMKEAGIKDIPLDLTFSEENCYQISKYVIMYGHLQGIYKLPLYVYIL